MQVETGAFRGDGSSPRLGATGCPTSAETLHTAHCQIKQTGLQSKLSVAPPTQTSWTLSENKEWKETCSLVKENLSETSINAHI